MKDDKSVREVERQLPGRGRAEANLQCQLNCLVRRGDRRTHWAFPGGGAGETDSRHCPHYLVSSLVSKLTRSVDILLQLNWWIRMNSTDSTLVMSKPGRDAGNWGEMKSNVDKKWKYYWSDVFFSDTGATWWPPGISRPGRWWWQRGRSCGDLAMSTLYWSVLAAAGKHQTPEVGAEK